MQPARPLLQVLVVDDHEIIRLGVRHLLEQRARCVDAASLADAQARLAEQKFDLMLLDLGLGADFSLAALPALRADNQQVAASFFTDPAMAELPYARGELLALRWNAALRARGHLGLDPVMRGLMLPPAQAQRQGPLSKPLITHRLLAALRPTLGETPLQDLSQFIEQGLPFELSDTTLGPCFRLAPDALADQPRYEAVADGLNEPRCRAWIGIGGDAPDPSAGADAAGGTRTVMVCKAIKGKKAKVCKPTVVRAKALKAGAKPAAPDQGAKPAAGRPKAGKAKAAATSSKKAKPRKHAAAR